MQNTTELVYFTLYNHTSGQHIRFTSHSKSSNSIQTSDSSQKIHAMLAISDICSSQNRKYGQKKPKITGVGQIHNLMQ